MNYDIGIQEDFDNMTDELGYSTVEVYLRDTSLNYEGQEGDGSTTENVVRELAFLQELDSTHEMVATGQLNMGAVRITFKSDSIVEEECYIKKNSNTYKIIRLTKVRGMKNDRVLYIIAYGNKVPNR